MLASWLFNLGSGNGREDDSDDASSPEDEGARADDSTTTDMLSAANQRDQTVRLLRSILECSRELMVNVWKMSPRVIDELQKLISEIGHNPKITQLYELFFNVDGWLEAIEPFSEVVTVSTVFYVCNYVQRNRLDQMVYDMLQEQGLICTYEMYQSVATTEFLAMLTPVVKILQFTKRFAKIDQYRIVQLANLLKSELLGCGAKNFHALTFALLTMIDATTIRHLGQRYAKVVLDGTEDLANRLQKIQETIAAAASSAAANYGCGGVSNATRKRRRSEEEEEEEAAAANYGCGGVSNATRKRRRSEKEEEEEVEKAETKSGVCRDDNASTTAAGRQHPSSMVRCTTRRKRRHH